MLIITITFSNTETISGANTIADSTLFERVRAAITRGQHNLRDYKTDGEYWNYYSHLGPHLTSLFYLVCNLVGKKDVFSIDDIENLKQKLLKEQHENGSWHAVFDKNLKQGGSEDKSGDILATIYNYFALKVMGIDSDLPNMVRAKEYIIGKGGIEKAPLFCKIFLALFNNFSWAKATKKIPYLVFSDKKILKSINVENFAQWIGPHLRPIAYLREFQVTGSVADGSDQNKKSVRELYHNKQQYDEMQNEQKSPSLESSFQNLVQQLLDKQQPQGSWGGYTLSTLLSVIALEHYRKTCTDQDKLQKIEKALEISFTFLKIRYLEKGKDGYLQGSVMDGRVWDTSLCTRALLNSGLHASDLQKTIDFLKSFQIRGGEGDGGISYGYDFEYAPDVDDTSEYILALDSFGGHTEEIKKGIRWIEGMQNKDGGFAAFQKDKSGSWLLRKASEGFDDSAELFDRSCPDLTGHVLEALGSQGYSKYNSKVVQKAIIYLQNDVKDYPAWFGRWGVNYIYGTSAAIVGLIKVGEKYDEPYIKNAVLWMKKHQNHDGGFGESTESYLNRDMAGKGVSTPSQTAWALQALLTAGEIQSVEVIKGVQYLLRQIEQKGKWEDESAVGTGHPGIIYMNYPAYPGSWSLSALSQYLCDASKLEYFGAEKTSNTKIRAEDRVFCRNQHEE